MRIIQSLALVFIGCFSILSHAQESNITDDVKHNVIAKVDAGNMLGAVIGYFDGDKVEYFSYGKTRTKNGENVDENSVFEIGSISKVFTTILLANKVINGEMKLSDPISLYLPEHIKTPKRQGEEITLKDLATHSSGFPRMPNNISPSNRNNPYADYTIKELYSFISSHTLSRDIGERFEYSNLGMGLLGHILELQSGINYEDLIIKNITDPLKMDATRVKLTQPMKAKLAFPYSQGRKVENWDFKSTFVGAGGIRSTAKDMVKFLQANILQKESSIKKAMLFSHKSTYKIKETDSEMGLGWLFANDKTIIWHGGNTAGYSCFIGFIPGTEKGVVVLTNSTADVKGIGAKLIGGKRPLTPAN